MTSYLADGFDDALVTLCDGAISVDGIMVSGSRSFRRDPRLGRLADTLAFIDLRRVRRTLIIFATPRGKHWCSHPDHNGYDENGQPDDGWRPAKEFTEFTDRHGNKRLHNYCDGCRAKHARRMYALQREAEGKPVRGYQKRQAAYF